MPDAPENSRPRRSRSPRRIYRRWWFWAIVIIGVLAVASVVSVGWIAARAQQARAELESAQTLVPQLKAEATKLDAAGATRTLSAITSHTKRALALTSDPIWRAAEHVPFAGANLTAVRQLAAVTDSVMTDVAGPLVGVAAKINPASFAPKDGAIDVKPLTEAIPAVARASAGLKSAVARVAAIDTSGTISQVSAAKAKISRLLASVAPVVGTLNSILPLLPPALGTDAPRTYVLMFQNNAESRALGGTALSFATIKIDKGHIALGATIPAGLTNFSSYPTSVIPLPDGTLQLYEGALGTFIANVTVRPSFTTAAEITQEMWKRQFGYTVDGILSIDPVALGYVLRATGPIALPSGDSLTSASLVPLLLNTVYERYNTANNYADNLAQNEIYSEAVGATFRALTDGKLDAKKLVAALMQGWNEHRILYWSAHKDEETQLADIGLNGELPVSDSKTARVGVYFQDNVGSKLNFYLKQSVQLAKATCRADGRQSYRVTVDLTSDLQPSAVKKLSPSIAGNWKAEKLQPGVQRMIVMLFAPPGSRISGASVNGTPTALESLHDTSYPVGRIVVKVNPGASATLTYDIVAAKPGTKALEALVTPMVNPTPVTTVPLDCATVAKN
jgi:hypothetical protein